MHDTGGAASFETAGKRAALLRMRKLNGLRSFR
jgi:hypothetical protein